MWIGSPMTTSQLKGTNNASPLGNARPSPCMTTGVTGRLVFSSLEQMANAFPDAAHLFRLAATAFRKEYQDVILLQRLLARLEQQLDIRATGAIQRDNPDHVQRKPSA